MDIEIAVVPHTQAGGLPTIFHAATVGGPRWARGQYGCGYSRDAAFEDCATYVRRLTIFDPSADAIVQVEDPSRDI